MGVKCQYLSGIVACVEHGTRVPSSSIIVTIQIDFHIRCSGIEDFNAINNESHGGMARKIENVIALCSKFFCGGKN